MNLHFILSLFLLLTTFFLLILLVFVFSFEDFSEFLVVIGDVLKLVLKFFLLIKLINCIPNKSFLFLPKERVVSFCFVLLLKFKLGILILFFWIILLLIFFLTKVLPELIICFFFVLVFVC